MSRTSISMSPRRLKPHRGATFVLMLLAISACQSGESISNNTSSLSLSGMLPLQATTFLAYVGDTSAPSGKVHGTSNKVCLGEPLGLSVDLDIASNDTAIYINGTPGRQRYMQFWSEGNQPITIMTRDKQGAVESTMAWVEVVADCTTLPEIVTAISRADTREMHFSVANADQLVDDPSHIEQYEWMVHDGSSVVATATTDYPTWTHRFDPGDLDYDRHFTQLVIDVSVRTKDGDREAYRTFTVRPTYQMVRDLGTVQPPVSFDPLDWDAGLTIHNVDRDKSLEFTDAELTFWSCTEHADGEAPASVNLPSPPHVSIPPGESRTISFFQVFGKNSLWEEEWETCGLGVRLLGKLGETPAEANAYVELRQFPFRLHDVENDEILNMLRTAREQGLWPEGTDTITQRELWRLQREGRLDVVPGGLNELDGGSPDPGTNDAAPDNIVLINNPLRCDPYDEEDVAPAGFDGWECLPIDEYEQSVPYVANAHAGDIPLSSACGMVGSLLRAVTPAQRFSHTGIFTRSQDQIRHSTAAEARIQEDMGASSQIRPRRLTYPQPGIITQSVLGAYDGSLWQDTEFPDESYIIDTFNDEMVRCNGDADPTPPTLLRWSHNVADASDIQLTLERATQMAGHYRFFSYSNGAIATDTSFDDPDATVLGEDGRNRATVCSSFLWTAAHEAGLTLEANCDDDGGGCAQGIFEARDRRGCDGGAWGMGCAERDAGTLDGLYYYSPEERLAAGRALYASVYSEAGNTTVLPGQRNQVANQVTNCFALDKCSTYDGDGEDFGDGEWEQELNAGRAVSPDDLLFWDAPYAGNTEPIIERQGFMRQIYAWQPPESCTGTEEECRGSIRVTVRGPEGQLIEGATVDLARPGQNPSNVIDYTNELGELVFAGVPVSDYQVAADVFVGEDHLIGSTIAHVTAGEEHAVEIILANDAIGRVSGVLHLTAVLWVRDADFVSPEADSVTREAWIEISDAEPVDIRTFSLRVDNEVELKVTAYTTLEEFGAGVILNAGLYEGSAFTGLSAMDFVSSPRIRVPDGYPYRWNGFLEAHEFGKNSTASYDITLEYVRD